MSDPWYPGAVKRPIPEADSQAFIVPRLAILHTNGASGHSPSLYSYYARTDVGGESHFQVALSGVAEQYMPVNRRADTNSAANSFELGGTRYGAVSFETEDLGWGAGAPGGAARWTDAQMEFLAGGLVWLNQEWSIPAVLVPAWNGAGIGIHRMYPEWTSNPAKSYPYKQCPGDARDAQFHGELLPEVQRRLAPPPPEPLPQEDLMAPVYFRNSQNWVACLNPYDGNVRGVTGPEFYGALRKRLEDAVLVDDATWDALFAGDTV